MSSSSPFPKKLVAAIVNDMAYLYALIRSLDNILTDGLNLTEEEFTGLLNEWRKQSAQGIRKITAGNDNVSKGAGLFFGAPAAEDE